MTLSDRFFGALRAFEWDIEDRRASRCGGWSMPHYRNLKLEGVYIFLNSFYGK